MARLRRRDVLRRLLDVDRGLDDRFLRRNELCGGLRWTEMGRLSGRLEGDRWRCDLERRCGVGGGTAGGKSGTGGCGFGMGGCVGTDGKSRFSGGT